MAYQYDEFGNVIGEYESEEERRAKELADTAVETQEIKTYGDGTVEQVTKRSLPPELQQAQAAYQQTVAPVPGPVSPEQMAYTRQQESGGRRDIGYHFQPDAQGKRQSSAFGPYGITEAAYKDIAKQDPSLAKPITEWTQEEHDRGYNTLVGRNQKRLTQLGVEPTGGALQLSHLLGPDGAAKFLKTGEVSEAAAAANGGAERLKQIASGRFAGGASASSGAAKQPQAQPQPQQPAQIAQPVGPVSPEQVDQQAQILTQQLQQLAESQKQTPPPNSFDEFGTPVFSPQQANLDMHLNNYQGVQDSPDQLLNLSKDPTLPDWLKERSRNRAADLIIEQRQDAKAQKEVEDLDENKIARLLRERKGEGSRMKGMLYAAFGLTDLANEEKYKLGIGTDKADTINGEPVVIKVAANGKAIDGISAVTGKELTAKEIAAYNSNLGGALGKGASVSAEVYVDQTTGKRYRSGTDSSGRSAYVSVAGGPPFKGNEKDLVPQSIGTAAAKAEATNAVDLRYTGPKAYTRAGADFAGKFNAENGTNIGYASEKPGAPLIDKNTGREIVPDSRGNITATRAGGGTVTQGGAPAGAAPGAAPAQSKLPAPPTMNPGESPAAFAERTKAWSKTYEKQYESQERNTKAAKDLLPYVNDMKKLIDKSTSSGVGSIVDNAGNFFGYSTAGAEAIAAIAPLANKVLMGVERFEGPQSDQDVKSYKEAAGRLADPTIPAAQKQAAFNTIVEIMKRNAPDLDWAGTGGGKNTGAGTTSSGNKYKKVQ
jgi:hypothetical protein